MAKASRKFGYTVTGTSPVNRDDNSRHHYRTEIPNLVDEMELSVYAFRLYARLKRVAGDSGQCWESTRTLADACKMSVGQVSKAKLELSDAKLINLQHRDRKQTDLISIADVWPLNFAHFAGIDCAAQDVHHMNNKAQERSPHEHDVHHMNVNVHHTVPKKNSLIRTDEEKEEIDLLLIILDELSRELAQQSPAHEWLKGCCLLKESETVYELVVLDAKGAQWVRHQLKDSIRKKLSGLVGKRVDLEIVSLEKEQAT